MQGLRCGIKTLRGRIRENIGSWHEFQGLVDQKYLQGVKRLVLELTETPRIDPRITLSGNEQQMLGPCLLQPHGRMQGRAIPAAFVPYHPT